jgi:DNA polymerase
MSKWSVCSACELGSYRTNPVFFRGHVPADLMFIGDHPDDVAVTSGVPYTGPLEEEFLQYSPDRKFCATYLTVCTDHKPSHPEIQSCWSRLLELIKLVNPKVICTLGKQAEGKFLRNMQDVISQLNRGVVLIRVNSPFYVHNQAKDKILEIKKIRQEIERAFSLRPS